MLRILAYIILFMLGYRVLKRFFAPNLGEAGTGPDRMDHSASYPTDNEDKSNVIEDVDYEEVE